MGRRARPESSRDDPAWTGCFPGGSRARTPAFPGQLVEASRHWPLATCLDPGCQRIPKAGLGQARSELPRPFHVYLGQLPGSLR